MLTHRARTPAIWHQLVVTAICLPLLFLVDGPASAAMRGSAARRESTRKLQDLLNEVAERLALSRKVRVTIVPVNPHLLSVEAPGTPDGEFQVSVEENLIALLTPDELRAAFAHELGHVWIFTHHPYLQTERLANEIAMRVVTRDSLAQVYGKIWERDGKKGNLETFLGS